MKTKKSLNEIDALTERIIELDHFIDEQEEYMQYLKFLCGRSYKILSELLGHDGVTKSLVETLKIVSNNK